MGWRDYTASDKAKLFMLITELMGLLLSGINQANTPGVYSSHIFFLIVWQMRAEQVLL